MSRRTAKTMALAGLLAGLTGACSSGDDPDGDGQGAQSDTGGGGDAAGVDLGSAVLSIGDETWTFDAFSCAFGHEATQSDVYAFSSSSFGEHSSGARVQMQAEIRDEAGLGRFEGDVIYEIYIADIDDFDNPSVGWETTNDEDPQLVELGLAPPSGEAVLTIDGDAVTGEGYFDDRLTEGVFERIHGTIVATCGSQSRR